jgi:hypothetical protein
MNFNLSRLLTSGAYMSRNFSSTVIRSCPKAIFNKLWDQFPTMMYAHYNFQQIR